MLCIAIQYIGFKCAALKEACYNVHYRTCYLDIWYNSLDCTCMVISPGEGETVPVLAMT